MDNAVIIDKEQNKIDLDSLNKAIATKFGLSIDKVILVWMS